MKFVEETEDWKQYDCTSCYSDCSKLDGITTVARSAIVLYQTLWKGESIIYQYIPKSETTKLKITQTLNSFSVYMHRFRISAVISDDTGELQVTLFDREVRTLLGKTVQQVQTKVSPTKHSTFLLIKI